MIRSRHGRQRLLRPEDAPAEREGGRVLASEHPGDGGGRIHRLSRRHSPRRRLPAVQRETGPPESLSAPPLPALCPARLDSSLPLYSLFPTPANVEIRLLIDFLHYTVRDETPFVALGTAILSSPPLPSFAPARLIP